MHRSQGLPHSQHFDLPDLFESCFLSGFQDIELFQLSKEKGPFEHKTGNVLRFSLFSYRLQCLSLSRKARNMFIKDVKMLRK